MHTHTHKQITCHTKYPVNICCPLLPAFFRKQAAFVVFGGVWNSELGRPVRRREHLKIFFFVSLLWTGSTRSLWHVTVEAVKCRSSSFWWSLRVRWKGEMRVYVQRDRIWGRFDCPGSWVFFQCYRNAELVLGCAHFCFLNGDKYASYLYRHLLEVEPCCIFGPCFICKESDLFRKLERLGSLVIVWFLNHCAVGVSHIPHLSLLALGGMWQ